MEQLRRLLRETAGQDMIEYALMAAFLAVSAGAFVPGINAEISVVFSKIGSSLSVSASVGG
jgi:Flp pilus assembly pilin Flp